MSDKPKIWLSSPHMGGEELSYIHEVFEKNLITDSGNQQIITRHCEEPMMPNVGLVSLPTRQSP